MPALTIQQAFDLAFQQQRAGNLAQAEQLYRLILKRHPDQPDAIHYLGVLTHRRGEIDAGIGLIRLAIHLRPDYVEAYANLGNALSDKGELDQAIAAYRQALALRPGLTEVYYNLGIILKRNGNNEEAMEAYRRAISLRPNYAEAHSNLGVALQDSGNLEQSLAAHHQAVAIKPDLADIQWNFGNALFQHRQVDEAIAAYRRAIASAPSYGSAYNSLGIALQSKGQLEDALTAYRKAIALNPRDYEAHSNLAVALKEQGLLDEAIGSFRDALFVNPNSHATHSNLLLALLYHPDYDSGAIASEHRLWNSQQGEPLRKFILPHSNEPDPNRRLRIGYVSPDLRDHVVGRNLLPLFSHHNHDRFDITCYAQVAHPDAVTAKIQQNADRWRNIVGLSDERLARQIRDDRIDILVDLALHSGDNRLPIFARKPAPVQVTFAGYPGSTGLSAMDYRLSDPYLDPPGVDESIYTEKTIRLADSFWCYDPSTALQIPINSPPAPDRGSITFGCLNSICKINRYIVSLWARVLRQSAGSRLLLLAPKGAADVNLHGARELLRQEEIDLNRVGFVPFQSRQSYLEAYNEIDIGLDSFPYNGHTTSLDSFWMGVPVITLVGERVVSRAGFCQLSNLGLAELAGHTPDQFVQIAVELARDLPRLRMLRASLRERMLQSPLMDARKFARNIESAFEQAWGTWCASRQSVPASAAAPDASL